MIKPRKKSRYQAFLLLCALGFISVGMFGCAKKAPPPIIEPPKKEIKAPEKPVPPPSKPVETPQVPQPVYSPPPQEPVMPQRVPAVDFVDSNYEMIHFEYDQSRLLQDARRILKDNVGLVRKDMQKNPGLKLLIDGHCDERGTNEYNLALGERRAFSARDYMISLGIPANILYTKSWGEEKPLDPGRNERAWAKNRRAEFNIYKGE